MVGQRTLTPLIVVRIHVKQPFGQGCIFYAPLCFCPKAGFVIVEEVRAAGMVGEERRPDEADQRENCGAVG